MSKIITEYGFSQNKLKFSKLSDLCVEKIGIQTGPFGSQLHNSDYVEYGTPIITVEHLGNNFISHDNTPFVSNKDKKRLSKYLLQEGDIVFSRVGSVDRRAYVSTKESGWLFSGRCLRIRVKPELIDAKYLSYFFGLNSFKNYIRGIAVGATMPSINTKILSDIPIYFIEDINKQKEVAEILGNLDDKIQLNTQINQTLEQIAQAIFKSWFIDFDPVHAKANALANGKTKDQANLAAMSVISGKSEEELNRLQTEQPEKFNELWEVAETFPSGFEMVDGVEVPRGWGLTELSSLFTFIGGAQPPKSEHIYEPKEGYERFIQNRDYSNDNHKTYIPISKRNKRCEIKDILMDKYGEAGRVRFGIAGAYNVALAKIEPKQANLREYLRSYFSQDNVTEYLASSSVASTRNSLNSSTFTGMKIFIPCDKLLNHFEKIAGNIIDKSLAIKNENEILSNTRDCLLPKLLNGEI